MVSGGSALAGKRVVVTRAAEQCEALCRELEAHGATPVVLPLVAFGPPEDAAPLDAALRRLSKFDWMLLTSQNAVRAVAERCETLGISLDAAAGSLRVAAVGPVTAKAAEQAGMKVRHVAAAQQGVALAEELGGRLRGCSVFLPRSDRANPALPETLARLGARVTEVVAYRTLAASPVEDERRRAVGRGDADAILFFSPSAVQQMKELVGAKRMRALQERMVFAAIGPVTAAALREAGVAGVVVAPDASVAGILTALAVHWQGRSHAEARQG